MPAYEDEQVIEDFWRKPEIRSMGANVKRCPNLRGGGMDPQTETDQIV